MKTALLLSLLIIILSTMIITGDALGLEPPDAPKSASEIMPTDTSDFGSGLLEIFHKSMAVIKNNLRETVAPGVAVYSCILFVSVINTTALPIHTVELAGAVFISAGMIQTSHSMIALAFRTIEEIREYSKLFLPIITAASAAQGHVSSSTALYIGTAAFTSFITVILSSIYMPCIYLYLISAIAHCAIGNEIYKQTKNHLIKISAWFLKTAVTVFLAYMSITGVVTGSADQSALKITKSAIRAAVPVIGNSLADASDALLLSIGIAKNAIGIYGILVFISLYMTPFLRIGVFYLVLKAATLASSILDNGRLSELVSDFCNAMGLLLGMIGSICIIMIIGTVCYMRSMV